MQHEALHGHPTRSAWLNELLVYPSLWLWFPYRRYARLHRPTTATSCLTDPRDDPESFYMLPSAGPSFPPRPRVLYRINNTLAGRMLIGPAIASSGFIATTSPAAAAATAASPPPGCCTCRPSR